MQAGLGIGRVEGSFAPGNGTALAKVGNDMATGKAVAPDLQARETNHNPPEFSGKQYAKHVRAYHDKVNEDTYHYGQQYVAAIEEKMQAFTEAAKDNPALLKQGRKLLAELKEQLSSVPRRKLEPPDNLNVCLDVSGSNFDKEILSPTLEGTPGQEVRADLFLNVKNNCGEQADHADFIVTAAITCPPGYNGKNYGQAYRNTNPANIPDGGQAVQDTAIFVTGECTQVDQNGTPLDSILPTTFTVSVLAEAIGHDSSQSLMSDGYAVNII